MANKGRPNRRAASKTHFFKYQLAGDPNRAEENDLKRALQESLLEQFTKSSKKSAKKQTKSNYSIIINSSSSPNTSSEVSRSTNNSNRSNSNTSYSNQSATSSITSAIKNNNNNNTNTNTNTNTFKRTRSSVNNNNNLNDTSNNHNSTTPQNKNKRAKTNHINNHNNSASRNKSASTISNTSNISAHDRNHHHRSAPTILVVNDHQTSPQTTNTTNSKSFISTKAIKTYSRNQPINNNHHHNKPHQIQQQHQKSSTQTGPKSSTPIKNPFEVGRLTDKVTPHQNTKSPKSQTTICVSKSTQSTICPSPKDSHSVEFSPNNLLRHDTTDLSNNNKKNQNQTTNVKVQNKRLPQGSWSLLGIPEEKTIYMREDEPPKRLICYPAIKHIEGDVIQVRDSVLLRSGARKTDLPYIAKVCSFWEDAESGNVMMSLFWYYRPEHTEEGRKMHHLPDEIFASRHRDVDSVECIEDKCYVLTFNEYCRYRKRCKMEQVNTAWSLTDVTIPVSNELYPRRHRIPDSDVNPELVFCCRQIYDSRLKRLVKNPLINPKYGHI